MIKVTIWHDLDFRRQHTVETYKGLLELGRTGLRAIYLLNGGALVAILALLGRLVGQNEVNLLIPIGCFVLGLVFAVCAHLLAYVMQLQLFSSSAQQALSIEPAPGQTAAEANAGVEQENQRAASENRRHRRLLRGCVLTAVASLALFAVGAIAATFEAGVLSSGPTDQEST